MTHPLISAQGLSKIYKVYETPWDRLREAFSGQPRHEAFEALQDVSFDLPRGESLGVIGENGAGKSTLLKLISGVTTPTIGSLEVRGTVASLLELGMGFHQEFSGRQNIRLNAAMLGLSEADLETKIPEIIAFSELGEFIDRPVKTYSTGMAMRLGFAIAVQVEPEILIIDEALSVGDGYFQKKCMDCLQQLVRSGRTLLFCSHAMYYVSAFCQRALWLREGRVERLGPVDEVVTEYENFLLAKSEASSRGRVERSEEAAKLARIVNVCQPRAEHESRGGESYRHRERWILEVEWKTPDPRLAFHLGIGIDRIDGVQICSFGTHRDGMASLVGSQHYRVRLLVPELPMLKGEFSVFVYLLDEAGLHVYDQEVLPSAFSIEGRDYPVGLVSAEHSWDLGAKAAVESPQKSEAEPELAGSRPRQRAGQRQRAIGDG